ncbi:polysaccharide biosynthesis protein CapD [Skermanella aerolata]|uniref:Polysaccharide biosynthesis protein CapD n=1 Tax=Skermanella aerolata TaxID=393310 RepID=A0A512DQJ9_9PROT|nr:nucleoside-diphosphate sugar epimerase/dehydratase [Skermanella aerolata]KJB93394.1 polysaccharide biosynthesis protein CapD [Skermanella aerolata KACC 11604]GEO38737.1 polysaccharide biosynthesis protein CapD [Skermanella aerolata]
MKMDRSGLAYLHDVLMTGLAFVAAFYMRVGDQLFGYHFDGLVQGLPVVMLTGAITYRLFGLYRGIWRYASTPDLIQVTKAATIVSVVSVLLLFLLTRLDTIPRSIPVIQWFVLLILLGGPRFAYRLFKDRRLSLSDLSGNDIRIPVLLVGAGDGADQLIRALSLSPQAVYRVVGLVDDKGGRVGRAIRGVPVLGDVDSLPAVVESLHARGIKPQKLVVTKQESETDRDLIRRLLDLSEPLGLSLNRLPNLTEFKDALGEGKIELRPVAVEDLLGRPQTVLNRDAIVGLIAGRRVLVTGAGGTIGSELTRQIAALGPAELTMVDAGEFNLYTIDGEIRGRFPGLPCNSVIADVRDRSRIAALFQQTRPDLVFHAAALKHVPLVEANPEEGVLTNAIGTRNVADAARTAGTRAMVLISTDKAINPSSVMGATKRVAEAYCQSLDLTPGAEGTSTRFMTVRFGNVLGSSGSVVPLFQRQLASGGPLTVTHPDMRRYFMTVREAVELVLQASAYGSAHPNGRGRIFVLDMGEPVRIVDLARNMIRLAGLRPDKDIRIEFTGLRPGEKLFEELLSEGETPTQTEADGVFQASPRVIDHALINRTMGELEQATRAGDRPRTMSIIRTLVPDHTAEAAIAHPASQTRQELGTP